MTTLQQACEQLESASRDALTSLEAGDERALERSIDRRVEAFSRLERAAIQARPGPAERAVLRRLRVLDEQLRVRALEAQALVRDERLELARSLRAARALAGGASAERAEPRFVARHA